MSASPETNNITIYFKVPYTDITTVVDVDDSLTTMEFLEYVNNENNYIRDKLYINSRFDIEVVDTGKPGDELACPMEPRYDETLSQRYGQNKFVSFYARPVHPITREFRRSDNYFD